ncbi:MAG: hypothetical protein OQK99_02520 [Gammaproteobacteria bacterium]|nr:hypothetical protein [Gammaproteobacteria bacterium]
MNDQEFLEGFERCTIPREKWSHEAHIRMAWLYLTCYPLEQALEKICSGIQRYNKAVTGSTDGYHHTVTLAFSRLIAARLAPGEDYAAFRVANPDLYASRPPVLARFYSDEHLFSEQAKREWRNPDLEPLPTPAGF